MCIEGNAYFCSGGGTACYMLSAWKNFRFVVLLGIVLDL